MTKKPTPIKPTEKKILYIAMFSHSGIPIATVQSLIATIGDLNAHDIVSHVDLRPGGPYVMKERNVHIQRFLQTDATHMLFIDGDLAWNPEAVRKMLDTGKEFIGGLYPYKDPAKEGYPCQLFVNDETGEYHMVDGCYEAAGIPTGFMMFERSVIQRMIREYPETKFHLKNGATGEILTTLYDLFDCLLYKEEWWGEDYVFCRRWTALGGKIWVYPDIEFAHINNNYGHIGNFANYYQRGYAAVTKRNLDEVEMMKAREAATTSEAA